jgi:conjugal transfer mating pair stabilization protein TraG
MGYEIYSYGNNIALVALFNAIAAIVQNQTYHTIVYVVFVVGFLGSFGTMAVGKDIWAGPRWLVTAVLIYFVLLVPTASVQIIDKTNNQPPQVIGNVPWGLASQASIVSDIGNILTELFETAVQTIPAPGGGTALEPDLTYEQSGLMFGAKLIKNSHDLVFQDPDFRNEFTQFFANCTVYDLAQGHPSATTFANSTDIWPLMADTNPARYSTITVPNPNVPGSTMTDSEPCPAVYADLDGKMNAQEQALFAKLGLTGTPALLEQSPGISGATALAAIAASSVQNPLMEAYQSANLATAATDAATIVRQNAIINGIKDGGLLLSQQQHDPAALMMAQAKSIATAQTNSQYILSQQLAESTLPMIRNGIESISYALFPIILLLCLIHGGQRSLEVLKMYGLVLIWVALWPPLYAILSFLMSVAAEQEIAANGYANGVQGLTLATSGAIYTASISKLAVAGYMTTLVPAIASAVVFGLNKIANAAMTAAGVADRAVAGASADVAKGNESMGNVSMNKVSTAKSDNSAFQQIWDDAYGRTTLDIRDPLSMRYQSNVSSYTVSMSSGAAIAERETEAARKSAAFAQDQSRIVSETKTAAVLTALSHIHSSGVSTNSGTAFDFGEGGSNQRMTEAVQQARMQISKDLGISDAQVVDRVLAAAIGAKAGVGFDWGVVNGKVEAELKAAGSAKSMEEIQAAIKKSQAIMDSHNIKNADTFVNDFKKTEMWGKMQSASDQDSKRIDSSMNAARSAQASASASLRLSEEHRQTAETAASLESKFGINFANAFTNWLNRYYPGVIGPNRNPSEARLLELGAEFVRDSVIVRNADNTFKMVQRSEMGTISITPGSVKEAELNAKLEEIRLKTEVRTPDRETIEPSHTGDRQSSIPSHVKGLHHKDGNVLDSEDAARTRFDNRKSDENAKLSGSESLRSGKISGLQEQFKERADAVSSLQNLGRTPWSDFGALDQLERETGSKVPEKPGATERSKKIEDAKGLLPDALLDRNSEEKSIRPLGPVTSIRTGKPLRNVPQEEKSSRND